MLHRFAIHGEGACACQIDQRLRLRLSKGDFPEIRAHSLVRSHGETGIDPVLSRSGVCQFKISCFACVPHID